MEFTALPVKIGDSFLLKTDDSIILVDGGNDEDDIVLLLEKYLDKEINHIDLLICTHYDADHINGIIGILKSNKYSFKELWLPEIYGSIGYTLSKNLSYTLNILRDITINEKYNYDCENSQEEDTSFDKFEDIDNNVLDFFLKNVSKNIFHLYPYYEDNDNMGKAFINLYKISKLINTSLNSGAYIRWLKYEDELTTNSYNFDITCLNSKQTEITLYNKEQFISSLYSTLSPKNQKSLVFKYFKNQDLPNILFTADSNLKFCREYKINLNKNSIVTAPHHGSSANDDAYDKIKGDNFILVRSDFSQIKRPGKGYLNHAFRYCTICRNITTKQSIKLELKKDKFTTNARPCICNKK